MFGDKYGKSGLRNQEWNYERSPKMEKRGGKEPPMFSSEFVYKHDDKHQEYVPNPDFNAERYAKDHASPKPPESQTWTVRHPNGAQETIKCEYMRRREDEYLFYVEPGNPFARVPLCNVSILILVEEPAKPTEAEPAHPHPNVPRSTLRC